MPKTYPQKEELIKIVKRASEDIGEHVDAVEILVSTQEDGGGTYHIFSGCGNWYARKGMAVAFLEKAKARNSAYEIAMALGDEDDE